VLVPEEMILIDTSKAAEMFAKFDVPIGGYVVNRVIPEELAESDGVPAYLKNRIQGQRHYLGEIDRRFSGQVLVRVPELERDVTGLEMIEKLSRIMYGDV
jgi:arsenite-transporting ATPase